MIGEIGGPQEAEASAWIKDNMAKPVIGFVAGLTAPKGRRMGHAGAIISAAGDSAAEKAEIMRACGLTVAPNPSEFGLDGCGVLGSRPEAGERVSEHQRARANSIASLCVSRGGAVPPICQVHVRGLALRKAMGRARAPGRHQSSDRRGRECLACHE